ncbi:MAG: GNAT family N-acetyltransferase [Clostridia bacterium]|nr:GNAT family N-acetyltransferase [Clostridia bacterium]
MIYEEKRIVCKQGREVLLRSPMREDAEELISYMKTTAGETEFILRYPDEVTMTPEREEAFLNAINEHPYSVMICAFADGELAGNCSLSMGGQRKTRHVGEIGIALKRKFWGLGIGTALMGELESVARELGAERLELELIGGNERAKALYEKCGFTLYGERKKAYKLKEGYASGFLMEKFL